MRRLAIYEDRKPELDLLHLRLIHNGEGGIDVIVCRKDGTAVSGGYLLRLSEQGVYRHTSVNRSLGFPLNDAGRLKLHEE